jgi:hypothetical protein
MTLLRPHKKNTHIVGPTAKPCVKKIKKILKIKIKTALPPHFLRMRRMIN